MILYLHGRSDKPTDPPGDVVLGIDWPFRVRAPVLGLEWHSQRFNLRVREVARWLDDSVLAIGHSFGGWLLLSAAAQKLEGKRPTPPLLLLSTVLGTSKGRAGGKIVSFSSPPGVQRVHRALGISSDSDASLFSSGDLAFIHGAEDSQCPVEAVQALPGGYLTLIVPGGHRLDHPQARSTLMATLQAVSGGLRDIGTTPMKTLEDPQQ